MSNDRFKFRAWDKKNKILHYNAECAYDYIGGTPPLMADSFDGVLSDDNYVVEQCTGLKDKNGKLIYENDVVREHFKDGGSIDKLVFYNELRCKWYTKYNFRCSLGNAVFWEFGHHISHKLEIIGNIHEMEV